MKSPVLSATDPAIDPAKLLADELAGKYPDARGRFGPFGGRYVPETLFAAFEKLEAGMKQHLHSAEFQQELTRELRTWVGRPTALTHAPKLSKAWGAPLVQCGATARFSDSAKPVPTPARQPPSSSPASSCSRIAHPPPKPETTHHEGTKKYVVSGFSPTS